jgi:hypothetical protein
VERRESLCRTVASLLDSIPVRRQASVVKFLIVLEPGDEVGFTALVPSLPYDRIISVLRRTGSVIVRQKDLPQIPRRGDLRIACFPELSRKDA